MAATLKTTVIQEPSSGTVNMTLGSTGSVTFGSSITSNTITSAASTALNIQSAGFTAMTIDTSQNVGIGTTSPSEKLQVAGGLRLTGTLSGSQASCVGIDYSSAARIVSYGANTSTQGSFAFLTSNSNASTTNQVVTIDSSGNVGIGTTSPVGVAGTKLDVRGSITAGQATVGRASLEQGNSTNSGYVAFWNSDLSVRQGYVGYATLAGGGGLTISSDTNNALIFNTNATERMRIDTSGNLLVGSTSNYGGVKLLVAQPNNNSAFIVNNTTASPTANTIWSNYSAAASTNFVHFYATTSGNSVANFQVLGNGNVQNSNNSYGAFSDVSLKDNIVDATSKLDDLMKVQIRNYTLKNDPDKIKQIGVIAQELEIVFPSIVEEIKDRDQDGKLLETTTKSVKYSVFVPMLIKAIQELKADFDAYKAAHP